MVDKKMLMRKINTISCVVDELLTVIDNIDRELKKIKEKCNEIELMLEEGGE